MIKDILKVIRQRSVMEEVEAEMNEMFDLAQKLFSASSMAILEEKKVDFDLYARDREINYRVVSIRKKIVEHLSVCQCHNIIGELVFITLINDIERIGDYSKNLLDLSKSLRNPLSATRYRQKLIELQPVVESYFPKAANALFEGDSDQAYQVMDGHLTVAETCEGIISELLREHEIEVGEGIALALTSRWMKRVSSRLKTVASSAVNPFSLIGYREMPRVGVVDDD